MRIAIITCLIFIVNYSCFSQNKPSSWTLLQQENGVDVYYKYAPCSPSHGYDKELVLLKLVNTSTDRSKYLSWDLESIHDKECFTCQYPDEYHMKVTLKPDESIEGSCKMDCPHELRIFSKFTDKDCKKNYPPLSSFNLANFVVK